VFTAYLIALMMEAESTSETVQFLSIHCAGALYLCATVLLCNCLSVATSLFNYEVLLLA
jgi:hypothetical protein